MAKKRTEGSPARDTNSGLGDLLLKCEIERERLAVNNMVLAQYIYDLKIPISDDYRKRSIQIGVEEASPISLFHQAPGGVCDDGGED